VFLVIYPLGVSRNESKENTFSSFNCLVNLRGVSEESSRKSVMDEVEVALLIGVLAGFFPF